MLLEKAVGEFAKLPGVGRKTAMRLVLHLLRQDTAVVEAFGNAMITLKHEVKYCKVCHNISDTETCRICSNPARDASTICVVESIRDVMAVEATQQYRGLYHVLGGVISPMDGIGPSDLQIESLVERVKGGEVKEVILALSSTMEGDTTNFYISRKLDGMDVKGIIMNMMNGAISNLVNAAFVGAEHLDMASCRDLLRSVEGVYFPKYTVKIDEAQLGTMTQQDFTDLFTAAAADYYAKKEAEITPPVMRELERVILLRVVDEYWMEHIDAMQDLRQGIRLRAYAQTNPVDAYKKESLEMFEEMVDAMKEETVRRLYSVRLRQNEEVKRERVASGITENVGGDGTVKKRPTRVVKVGRNDLCPCGSGLKWKKCTCKEYHS